MRSLRWMKHLGRFLLAVIISVSISVLPLSSAAQLPHFTLGHSEHITEILHQKKCIAQNPALPPLIPPCQGRKLPPLAKGRAGEGYLDVLVQGVSIEQVDAHADMADQMQAGISAYQGGRLSEAIAHFQNAIEIATQQSLPLNRALALSYLSLAYHHQGDRTLAQRSIQASLALVPISDLSNADATNPNSVVPNTSNPDPIEPLSGAERQVRSRVLNSYGQLLLAWGQPEQALDIWQKAADDYRTIGDDSGVLGIQVNRIAALRSLGFYRQAQRQIEGVSAAINTQSDTRLKASMLASLGHTLRVVGQLDESETVLRQSVALAKQIGSPGAIASSLLNLGNTEQALGDRYLRQHTASQWIPSTQSTACPIRIQPSGQPNSQSTAQSTAYQAAIAAYQAATAAYQESEAIAPTALAQVQAELNVLDVQLKSTDWPSNGSTDWSTEGAQLGDLAGIKHQLQTLSPSRPTIQAHIHFADQLVCLNQVHQYVHQHVQRAHQHAHPPIVGTEEPMLWAKIILSQAIQKAESLNDQRALSDAMGSSGHLQELEGDRPTALSTTERALELARRLQALDLSYRWHWQMGRLLDAETAETAQNIKTTHGPDTQRTLALDEYQAAFDDLRALRRDLVALETTVQFSFRERIEPFYRQFAELLLQDPRPESLRQARAVLEALQLAELDNFFQDACSNIQPESLDTVIDQHDRTSAVVYSIILPDHLDVVLKLPTANPPSPSESVDEVGVDATGADPNLHYYSAPVSAERVQQTVRKFSRQLTRPHTLTALKTQAKILYQWLLEPMEADLAANDIDHLVFVLDGVLRNIPMAALHDGDRYLVDRYAISLSPGLQLLNADPLAPLSTTVLAAGISEGIRTFRPLPKVETELDAIASTVPSATKLLNQDFTEANVETALQNAPISVVHLATHGQFSSRADQTFILTHDGEINVNELHELLRRTEQNNQGVGRDTAIELLVLSACQTASGDDRAALGLAGVAVRAGARSTLASLWSVDDQATFLLITEFYRQLYGPDPNMSKARALHLAQQEVKNWLVGSLHPYEHPRYWSAFVLLGNWL